MRLATCLFITQINPANCGPASMAMVLNAIGVPRPASKMTLGLGMFDQENNFMPTAESVKTADSDNDNRSRGYVTIQR